MRVSKALLLLPAVLWLSACGIYYETGGRQFSNPEDALSYRQGQFDQALAAIKPLDTSIAGPAVIVLPTRDHLAKMVREERPELKPIQVDYMADGYNLAVALFARLIERRKIFTELKVVRAQSPDGVDVPSGGYLLWYKRPRWHILAAGEPQTTELKPEPDATPAVDGASKKNRLGRIFLGAIEHFIETHPAAPFPN